MLINFDREHIFIFNSIHKYQKSPAFSFYKDNSKTQSLATPSHNTLFLDVYTNN